MDWTKKMQEEIPVPESRNVASHFCWSETVLLLVYMQIRPTWGNPSSIVSGHSSEASLSENPPG